MPAPKISDAEFMALVNEHQSTIRVAEILGSVPGVVRARKRRLERRHDWRAPQFDARKAYNTAPVHSDNKAVIQWDIDEGVILVGSDAHIWPGPLTTVQRAFLHFAKHYDPAPVGIVANGDWFDGARAGRFPSIGFLETKRPKIKDEIEAVQNYMAEIEKHRRGAKLFWPLGNHDLRYEGKLAAMVPEFEGMGGFHLKDHFPHWSPCWRLDVNDDLVIKHRWANGLHAVYNNTLRSGKSFVTGHLHSLKVSPWTDYNGTRYGCDCGTMADPYDDQFVHYTEANPVNWRSGFVVLTIKNGRLLMPEMVQKWDDDHVEFRGNLIKV